jgi:hypothetical protein
VHVVVDGAVGGRSFGGCEAGVVLAEYLGPSVGWQMSRIEGTSELGSPSDGR